MKFYAIYSFDADKNTPVHYFHPPQIHKWQLTETNDQAEYDFLPKHRKYVRLFDDHRPLIDFLRAEFYGSALDETMGMLCELGHLSAWSLSSNVSEYGIVGLANIYIAPMPEVIISGPKERNWERDWKRIKATIKGIL